MFRAFTLVKNYSLFLKEKRALTNFFVNSGNNHGHSYLPVAFSARFIIIFRLKSFIVQLITMSQQIFCREMY